MRAVEVNIREYVPYNKETGVNSHYKDKYVKATFHQWGLEDSGDLENGFAVSVAIVEIDNGEINTLYPADVRFVD